MTLYGFVVGLFIQRLHVLSLAGLLLCQTLMAGAGGLHLCLASSGGSFKLDLGCNELEAERCCGEKPQTSLVKADLGTACDLCHDVQLEVQFGSLWLAGERGSPKTPGFILISDIPKPRVKSPRTLFFLKVCPQRAPPQVSDALRQFKDVVSLRI